MNLRALDRCNEKKDVFVRSGTNGTAEQLKKLFTSRLTFD